MTEQAHGRSFYRDDEITVDRDGIPHFTGEQPTLLKEYKRRVQLGIERIDGSGDEEERRLASNARKQARYRTRLLDGLHGRAWRRCETLTSRIADIKADGGEQIIFEATASLEKESIIGKSEAFTAFFRRSSRRRGQDMSDYIVQKERLWAELQERDGNTALSDDLLTFFLLDGALLTTEEQRAIILATGSTFETAGFQHA